MRYKVENYRGTSYMYETYGEKGLVWKTWGSSPTLDDVIRAAEKEFPGVPLSELEISDDGDDDIPAISLRRLLRKAS